MMVEMQDAAETAGASLSERSISHLQLPFVFSLCIGVHLYYIIQALGIRPPSVIQILTEK